METSIEIEEKSLDNFFTFWICFVIILALFVAFKMGEHYNREKMRYICEHNLDFKVGNSKDVYFCYKFYLGEK